MIAVLVIVAAGWAYTRRLPEGVLVGGVVAAVALLVLDLLRIPWSAISFLIALITLSVPAALRRTGFSPSGRAEARPTLLAIHAGTAAVVAWHVAYALRADLWDWSDWLISRRDFFFIWGYKARLFFNEHGIPWNFLRSLPNDFTHPDYPLFVPLLFDIQPVLTGNWQPATSIVALDTALAVALLAIVYRMLRDDFDPLFAAAATLALSGSALLPWVGFAEGPLVAYGGAAALLIRRGRPESIALATVFLSAAAMAKNEGIALAVAIVIALATTAEGRKILPRLWPVAVVIGIWLVARSALHLPTDLFTGAIGERVARNLAAFPRAFANVPTYQPFVWIVSLIAILFSTRRERFLLTVAGVQVFFYLAAYAITPHDVAGHVNGSWPRLTSHVTIFVAFAGATSIGSMLKR